jgi:predicted  nucleic acid-binding Zn-ribbon protein
MRTVRDPPSVFMVCEGICSVRVAREGRYSVYVVLLDEHTIWIVGAHREDGRRFVVHADENESHSNDCASQMPEKLRTTAI